VQRINRAGILRRLRAGEHEVCLRGEKMSVRVFADRYLFREPALVDQDYSDAGDAAFCIECQRLEAHGESLARAHVETRDLFLCNAEKANTSEYQALRTACEETHIDSELARLQFERHRRGHRKDTETRVWIM
jgi:hypothetical protein